MSIPIAPLERYETSYKHTISFMQDTYGISDIDIQKLDYGFISDYEHWLKTVRSCDHNTTMKYLSNFKKIVLICIKKKWLAGDPFGEFKMTKRKKKRKSLSQIDLNNLTTKQLNWKSAGGPAAVFHLNNLHLFARDDDDDLYTSRKVSGHWGPWQGLGIQLNNKIFTRLRILTHNVYGKPKNFCPYRFQSIGRIIAKADPAYDIVGFQEFYGVPDGGLFTCGSDFLKEAIRSTGRYKNSNNDFNHRPKVNNKPNGGLGVFTLHDIGRHEAWEWHNDRQGWYKSAEGFIFVRI